MLRPQQRLFRSAQTWRSSASHPVQRFQPVFQTPLLQRDFHVSLPRRSNEDVKAAFLRKKAERLAKEKEEAEAKAAAEAQEAAERAEREKQETEERMRAERFAEVNTSGSMFSAAFGALGAISEHMVTTAEERMEEIQAPAEFMIQYLEKFPEEKEKLLPFKDQEAKIKKFFEAKIRSLSGQMELDEDGNPIDPNADSDVETSDVTDLVWQPRQQGRWEHTMENIRDSFRNTEGFRKFNRATQEFETSQNPMVARLRDFREQVEEKVDETKETWETNENPLIMRLREGKDAVAAGDSESAVAQLKFLKMDSNFDVLQELRRLEEFTIPLILQAHRKPHIPLLTRVLEGTALSMISAEIRGRINSGHYLDPAVTEVRGIDLIDMSLDMEEEPVMQIMFQGGHVNCVRDAEGFILEGSEQSFESTHYIWHLKRNMKDRLFPWSIVNFQSQTMQRII